MRQIQMGEGHGQCVVGDTPECLSSEERRSFLRGQIFASIPLDGEENPSAFFVKELGVDRQIQQTARDLPRE